ncbi:PPE domain-containing protein [Actinophytocola sp.]|uniref:PPE domain-containing protein n=1 Tax=Actinophytocola sp. TaxID=1872138 RepID=UPI002D804603|nr:hypothetical protein [Actinophytocola sp.]HET9140677.1 hypothetical protein [Actinophytocola sp.]
MPRQSDDRYVTGDTNWDSFELLQLIGMVTDRVDLKTLNSLAEEWRSTGGALSGAASELGTALDRLMNYWRGEAAEQARADVARNAEWMAALGATAYEVGSPIEDSAYALRAAQDQMPDMGLAVQAVAGRGSAPDGAEIGELAGGPLGASIGATAAGTESAAAAQQAQNELKRQAVDVMRRFETAAVGIDAAIPAFEGPDAVGRAPVAPSPRRPQPVTPPGQPPAPNPPGWQELTGGQGTGASQHRFDGSGGGADRGLRVGGGGGGGVSGGGAMPTVLPGPGAGSGFGGGRVPGGGPGTGAVPTPERVAGTLPMSAALADPDGPHGATGAGAPMGAGMAGAGAGGAAGDHRRRFPVDADDPFALEKKASPPVIGL